MQKVAKAPCNECPFKRTSIPGYLGGGAHQLANDYLILAHSDANVACHTSPGFSSGNEETMRPCAGLAMYRNNVCKIPRDAEAAKACKDVGKSAPEIFAHPPEFLAHHDTPTNRRMGVK